METCVTKTEFKRELIQACNNNDKTKLIAIFHDKYTHVSCLGLIIAEIVLECHLCTEVCEQIICQTVEKGYADVVQILLEQAFNFTSRTHRGYPVQIACRRGHNALVKKLIYLMDQKEVSWQSFEGNESLVTICTQNGHLDILEFLVNRGASLDVKNVMPLPYYATINGHQDILKYLLQNMNSNFNVNMSTKTVGNTEHMFNLLHMACVTKQLHIIHFLIEKHAKVSRSIVERYPECIADVLQQKLSVYKVGDQEGEGEEREEQYSGVWNGISMECFPGKVLMDNLKTIVEVELCSCELKEVAHEIFLLDNVKAIDLSINCLEKLDTSRTMEWKCSKLEILNASKNRIQFIPNAVFTNLPSLTHLDLSYNKIEDLGVANESGKITDEKWNLCQLEFLDISYNNIPALPDSMSRLSNLREFQASRNNIERLPHSLIQATHRLETLNLSENRLQTLPLKLSRNWSPNLQTLNLKDNQLNEISEEICHLNHLNTLILSHNEIRSFPTYTEWRTQTLQKVDLSHNKLCFNLVNISNTPDERKFAKGMNLFSQPKYKQDLMPKTQSMEFSSSPSIEETYEIPVEIWANTLMYLDLSDNRISVLPDYIGCLTSLVNLNLSNNRDLTTLPPALGRLKNCFQLGIDNLRLSIPQINNERMTKTKAILNHLHTELRNSVPSRRMKLMVVGLAGHGKTTLLQVLKSGGPKSESGLHKSTATNGIEINKWTLGGGKENKNRMGPQVEFSTWDLGGQEVYYATHQCFLTKNTLYLLVFNLTGGDGAILDLQPWLLNIQARAPNSLVIIVGTHLDVFKEELVNMSVDKVKEKVSKLYLEKNQTTYPKIISIQFVSCTKLINIDTLARIIYDSASKIEIADTREKVIGQMVPKGYIELHGKIDKERDARRSEGKMLFLHYADMQRIAATVQDEDLHDKVELDQAASYLHNNGYILHYEELIGQLTDLYFIDPTWICDMFAQIVTVKETNNWVKNGIIKKSELPFIFQNQEKYFFLHYESEYLYIMEKFEILINLGDGRLMIPSMLPLDRPDLVDRMIPDEYDLEREDQLGGAGPEEPITITRQSAIIRRRFYFSYIPSGFWNRLISRVLVEIRRVELQEILDFSYNVASQNITYWRRGITWQSNGCRFVVESISKSPIEIGGMQPGDTYKRNTFLINSMEFETKDCIMDEGVDITVYSNTYEFRWMGDLVDQVESLLAEWFPGLDQQDVFGVQQVRRYCPWKVPKHLLDKLDEEKNENFKYIGEDLYYMFQYQDCVLLSIKESHILCEELNVNIPLEFLIPEVCLADLNENFKLNVSQFKFGRDRTPIGEGATATVFKGTYKKKEVAVKEFAYGPSKRRGDRNVINLSQIDIESTLQQLRMIRREVNLYCRLKHPFILQLLAASIRPLVIVLEYAPLGALSAVLSEKANRLNEEWIEKYNATAPPPMPGGVLGHRLTLKIALQIILAIEYLHKKQIIYRDLKSQNVLLFSLDEKDVYNIKLSDYGISMDAQPSFNKGQEGTPGFIPREAIPQKNCDNIITNKMDIFAYGMVMYELVTGRYPFYPRTGNQEITKAVLNNLSPDILGQNRTPCCPNLVNMMHECWRTPDERPTASQIIKKLTDPAFFLLRNHMKEIDKEGMHKVDYMLDIPHTRPQLPNKTSKSLCVWGSETERKRCSLINVENGKKIESRLPAEQPVEAACVIEEKERPPRVWISSRGQRTTKEAGYREIEVYGQIPRNGSYCCLWRYNVKDTVLCLTGDRIDEKPLVYASLLSGHFLAYARKCDFPNEKGFTSMKPNEYSITSERNTEECTQWNMVFKLQIGNSPVHSVVVVGEEIWCTCGGDIHLLDRKKRDNFHKINVCRNKDTHLKHLLNYEGVMYATTFKGEESNIIVISVEARVVVGRLCCMEINPYQKVIFKKSEDEQVEEAQPQLYPRAISQDNSEDEGEAASLQMHPKELHPQDNESSKTNFTLPLANANLSNCTNQDTQTTLGKQTSISKDNVTNRGVTDSKPLKNSPSSQDHEHREVRVRSIIARQGLLWVSRAMGDVLLVNIQDMNSRSFGEVIACLRVPHGDKTLYSFKSLSLLCQTQNEYVANYQQLVMGAKPHLDHILVWEGISLEMLEEIMAQNQVSLDMHVQRPISSYVT